MLAVEKDGFKVGTCKFCGQPIVWAFNDTGGGKIPLDAKAPTFAVNHEKSPGAHRITHTPVAMDAVLVSHFSTCPAKTRAYSLLREAAAAFRQSGAGVYPTCEDAGALIRKINGYLGIDGP